MLIYLRSVYRLIHPFDIDKTGFGLQSAFLSVNEIHTIRKSL